MPSAMGAPSAGGAPSGSPATPWHALQADAAIAALHSTAQGLASAEAARRLQQHGRNRLPQAARRSAARRFLLQFHDLLIYVLLAAAALSFLLDHIVDAAVVLAVVLLNASIGFVQEGKAEQALDAIRALVDARASVLRDGHRASLAAEEIVPGDVVLVEAGDRIPADLRLLRARGLRIEEAALTGESVAVEKAVPPVPADAALGDRTSLAFSGTYVAAGQGLGVVIGTGTGTELGRISSLLARVQTLETPLLRRMRRFARQLTLAILALAAVTFAFALLVRGYPLGEAFMIVVGLAVSAIPEGLPAIMTITLAIGVQRMAARNAIIRQLPAVETLGSVSVICSDKTGTLTRNEMTVRRLVTAGIACDVTGVGYDPSGALCAQGATIDPDAHPVLMQLVHAGLLCNDAELRHGDAGWQVDGDPMEGALVAVARKAGLDPHDARAAQPRTDEIPFDAAHRFMATLHHGHDGQAFILVKGAPEEVMAMCALEAGAGAASPIDRDAWHARADALAAGGHRVLGFARKAVQPTQTVLSFQDVDDAVFLGLAGFIDPPREEAMAAVRDCHAAGIRVVMITGDHAETAREIARQLGLSADPRTLSGRELEALDAAGLARAVRDTTVFARTTPEHKLRLVEALQAQGLVVAMTGDGVNDAPALKRADVGVAMGRGGTEVAKQAAGMVLADDNFASIVAAVREGRTVYDNLLKMIAWTLPTNGGEALTILAALAFGLALPITPAQILWINMVTAVALGLTLAFEPTEPATMQRPPRPAGEAILSRDLLWRIGFVSLLFVAGAFGMFFWAGHRDLPLEAARTLVVNTIVVMEIFYLFSVRYVHGSSLTWRGVLGTPAVLAGVALVVVAQLLLTYLPALQRIFETRALQPVEGLAVIAVGVALLLVVEVEKRLRHALRRGGPRTRSAPVA